MNKQELVEFAEKFFGNNVEIMKRKNADYTAQSGDAFANFMVVERTSGITNSTEIGFLTRMSDKFMRISSFVKNGELLVKDEAVSDSLSDLSNYCMLFAAFLEWKKSLPKEVSNG